MVTTSDSAASAIEIAAAAAAAAVCDYNRPTLISAVAGHTCCRYSIGTFGGFGGGRTQKGRRTTKCYCLAGCCQNRTTMSSL